MKIDASKKHDKLRKMYEDLQKKYKHALSYANLIQYEKEGWIVPKEQLLNEPAKERPTQYLQRTIETRGFACTKAWIGTDVKKPSQFVLNLRFANESKASEFKKTYCEIQLDNKVLYVAVL